MALGGGDINDFMMIVLKCDYWVSNIIILDDVIKYSFTHPIYECKFRIALQFLINYLGFLNQG